MMHTHPKILKPLHYTLVLSVIVGEIPLAVLGSIPLMFENKLLQAGEFEG